MFFRQRDNDLAFADNLFGETGTDVVGVKDLREEVDKIIKNFGTIETGDFHVQKFSDIAKDLDGAGIYKVKETYSKADIEDFSKLLYSRLGASSKHLLDANAALGGYDKFAYLFNIIRSETDYSKTPDYEASLTKASGLGGAGGSGTDGSGPMAEKTYVENVISGTNFEWPTYNRFAVIGNHSDI